MTTEETENTKKSSTTDSIEPTPKNTEDIKKEPDSPLESKESRIDYDEEINAISGHSIADLLDYFSKTVNQINGTTNISELSTFAEEVKTLFYKKYHFLIATEKKKWTKEGGNPDDFKLIDNDDRERFEDIYSKFKAYRKSYNEKIEAQKQENLKLKQEIIDKIKNLVHTEESLNSTFKAFKDLEKQWKEIGQVPAPVATEIWGKYNFAVEQFYDFIKINKDLRDLDQKKNYEEKIKFCEIAESLPYKDQPVKAFQELQALHDKWKNTGPVPSEERDEIWERFSVITKIINKAHNEFHLKRKQQEEENLIKKTALCEKSEAIAKGDYTKFSEWKKQQDKLKSLDTEWRGIGRVPRQDNSTIYQRLRDAFDNFFEKKKVFYEKNKAKESENLIAKIKLCEAAEKLQDSTDFSKITPEILRLQKKWKEIGPVPHFKSEEIWQRFHSACNRFFENKSTAFKEQKGKEKENLQVKETIIKEMAAFKPLSSDKENLEAIRRFQKQWDEIGFVPRNKSDAINKSYHDILTRLFDIANIDKVKQQSLSFAEYLKNKQDAPNFKRFLEDEQYGIRKKLQNIEKEIFKIENSLSRFSVSKGSEGFLKAYKDELEKKKELQEILTKKIQLIKKFFDQLSS